MNFSSSLAPLRRLMLRHPLGVSVAALIAVSRCPLAASPTVPYTWDFDPTTTGAQDGSGTWDSVTATWWNGTSDVVWPNTSTSDAVFGAGVNGTYTITVALTTGAADSIIFNNSGYTLSAATVQTITLSSSTACVSVANGATDTIGADVKLATLAAGASTAITGGGTLVIDTGGTFTYNSATTSNILTIAGSSGGGTGTTVQVNAGGSFTSPVGSGAFFVDGTLNILGGTVSSGSTLGIGQADDSAGTITLSSGTLSNIGNNNGVRFGSNSGASTGGTFNLNGGTLTVQLVHQGTGTVASSIFNFNGGTLVASIANATFMTGLTQANVRNGGATINPGNFSITIAQPLLHSTILGDNATDGGLTETGSGTLILTGANTYNGPTKVNAGTLELANSSALGASSITDSTGGQVQLAGNITINNALRMSGSGPGANGILENLSGNNTLTNFGFTSNIGTRINVAAGDLDITDNFALDGTAVAQSFRVIGTGTLELDGNNSTAINAASSFLLGLGTAAGPVIAVGNDFAFGAGTINFQLMSASTVESANTAAHTIANPLAFNDVAATFGTAGTGNLTFTGAATLGANLTATVNNTNTTFTNAISGAFSLTKAGAGTLILSGTNTYTGATNVNAGTLLVGGSITGSSLTTVGTGATLASGNNTSSQVGPLTVASDAVTAGAGGTLAPGNTGGSGTSTIGALFVIGNLNLGTAGTPGVAHLAIELGGTTAGSLYDQVLVTGLVNLNNVELDGSLVNGYASTIQTGDTFYIILNNSGNTVGNAFANQGAADANGFPTVSFSGETFEISYTADYNGGVGSTFASGGNDVALRAVPEPGASLLLLALAPLAGLGRFRRFRGV